MGATSTTRWMPTTRVRCRGSRRGSVRVRAMREDVEQHRGVGDDVVDVVGADCVRQKLILPTRRAAVLTSVLAMTTTTTMTVNTTANAYGLNKPPPSSDSGFFGGLGKRESYEERLAAMREAERRREEKEKEAEEDAPLVTLKSGLQYREYAVGTSGAVATAGSRVDFSYKVFRLSSGAYFKYSSGGTPVLLWARGYGSEGRDDVGDTVSFVLGAANFPRAVTPCVVGMRKGGIRRILVPPNLGWVDDSVVPKPDSFGAARRLENYRDGPLLFEIEVVRVSNGKGGDDGDDNGVDLEPQGDFSYRLPAPPTL